MLRLVSATVGPVSAATGAAAGTQTVEAYNAGSGSLNLTLSSSVPWISPSVGASRVCTTTTLAETCIPLNFALNTGTLSAGSYTGIVTVTDPNAVDSPQTITVTVDVGGGIPSSLTVYVPPGGAIDTPAPTNSAVNWKATTVDGNQWLSLTITGAGSFKFDYPYTIHVAAQPANTLGTYTGALAISGSAFAGDNKTVPVTMNVNAGAIAQQPAPISVTLAQGTPANGYFGPYITIAGSGQTGLSTTGPVVTINGNSSTWLAAAALSPPAIPPGDVGAALAFNVTGLSPGTYTASVGFSTNAVAVCNIGCTPGGTVTVPVTLTVEAKGSPVITYQGVQDNATFVPGDTVSQGDVMVVKGDELSLQAYTPGPAPPLSTQLADVQVLVNGTAVPLYYTSYAQIAFQMPVNTPAGTALVQVQRSDGSSSNTVSVNVATSAPKLLLIYGGPYGAIVNQDGTLPLPASYSTSSLAAHPAKAGDTLQLYAIGLGATNPPVATGAPAPSTTLARLVTQPLVNFGNNPFAPQVAPSFAGLAPPFAGLYQVNVQIPAGVGPGTVYVVLEFPTGNSNPVAIEVQ